MNRQLSEKIRYIGFICTCGIVLYHCPRIEDAYAISPIDALINSVYDGGIRAVGVLFLSWFFTVTGFLLFRGYSMKSYPEKMRRRVFSLLLPYLLWQLITVLIDTAQGQYAFSAGDFLAKTFLLQRYPIDGPLWYIYVVFLLALLSPPLYLLMKRGKLFAWAGILAIVLLTEACKNIEAPVIKSIIDYGNIGNILIYIPAYLVGAFFGYHHDEQEPPRLYPILSLLLTALFFDGFSQGFFYYVSLQMMPIAALYLLPDLPVLHGRKIYRLSFLMYAVHQPLIRDLWPGVLGFYMNTLGRLTMAASLGTLVTSLMLFGATVIFSALLYVLLSRFVPRLLALLTGGRG